MIVEKKPQLPKIPPPAPQQPKAKAKKKGPSKTERQLVMGRIVRFHSAGQCNREHEYPALITKVFPDRSVNLWAFGERFMQPVMNVPFDVAGPNGCWHWPPRTEAMTDLVPVAAEKAA